MTVWEVVGAVTLFVCVGVFTASAWMLTKRGPL